MGTLGSDIMQRINSGELGPAPTPEIIERVRTEVVPALAELIDFGFRARPLMVRGQQVGHIRGLHMTERRLIYRWYPGAADRIKCILEAATTLLPEEIALLDGLEARNLLRLIEKMGDADLSLYPYISAFSTTSTSEILWYGRGTTVASFNQKHVPIPRSSGFTILTPSDHARLWAGVAAIRERSKKRLDDTYNAAMITRAMAGKGADKLFTALKKTQTSLQVDSDEPWKQIVRVEAKDINFRDGWGHAHQDDSVEGVMREIHGMAKMDKHELFMQAFYDQQMAEANKRDAEIEARFAKAMEHEGIEDSFKFTTEKEVLAREAILNEERQEHSAEVSVAIAAAQADDERRELRSSGRSHPLQQN
jgi:hypothetical protein